MSVVVPIRNESKHIEVFLESIKNFDLSLLKAEFLLVDGMSEDGTTKILESFSAQNPICRVLMNAHKQKPQALNLGIAQSRSDIIIRLDAHSIYPRSYIGDLVKRLKEQDCANVGGIRETVVKGDFSHRVIARLIGHPFAAGNAQYRTSTRAEIREVDTVFGGCFRREIFSKLGGFNEKLLRTQDREMNFRIREAGNRIVLDPAIRCSYLPRTDLLDYIRWTYDGAFWLFRSPQFTKTKMLRSRNYVPIAFFLWAIGYLVSFLFGAGVLTWVLGTGLLVYFLLSVFYSIQLARSEGHILGFLIPILYFFITHFVYGLGSFVGFLDVIFSKKEKS